MKLKNATLKKRHLFATALAAGISLAASGTVLAANIDIIIHKVDQSGNDISGAEFTFYNTRRLSKNSSKLLPFLGTSVFLNYPAHFLRS